MQGKALKCEEQLKEEVRFVSIGELRLNPTNMLVVEDELMQMAKTKSRDNVQKQLRALKKAQESYKTITEGAA